MPQSMARPTTGSRRSDSNEPGRDPGLLMRLAPARVDRLQKLQASYLAEGRVTPRKCGSGRQEPAAKGGVTYAAVGCVNNTK
jgi:hypothetical protein